MDNTENRLDATLNINKYPTNQTKYYSLDKSQDWLEKLLIELNEKATERPVEEKLANTSVTCELEITKKQKHHMGNYLVVKGKFTAEYLTECVRTLQEMKDSVETEIKACFLSEFLEKDENFQEQTEIFEEDEMLELYFYAKGQVQLAEMIHEQVYLNVNQYPVADEDAPLAWGNTQTDTKQ